MTAKQHAATRGGAADDEILRWPDGVSAVTGIPAPTLKRRRTAGDHPRLFAVGRALFTTRSDTREWILSHEVPAGFRTRPPTRSEA